MATVGKCPICKKKYITVDPEGNLQDRKWDEREIVDHKINHIESGKVKRVVRTAIELSKDQLEEVLDFIMKYLS